MSATADVEIASGAVVGRGLVATRNVSAGEVLLAEEPIAATLLDSEV
jgi:hypothetical protein